MVYHVLFFLSWQSFFWWCSPFADTSLEEMAEFSSKFSPWNLRSTKSHKNPMDTPWIPHGYPMGILIGSAFQVNFHTTLLRIFGFAPRFPALIGLENPIPEDCGEKWRRNAVRKFLLSGFFGGISWLCFHFSMFFVGKFYGIMIQRSYNTSKLKYTGSGIGRIETKGIGPTGGSFYWY